MDMVDFYSLFNYACTLFHVIYLGIVLNAVSVRWHSVKLVDISVEVRVHI